MTKIIKLAPHRAFLTLACLAGLGLSLTAFNAPSLAQDATTAKPAASPQKTSTNTSLAPQAVTDISGTIAQIETYLAQLKTMKSRFLQTSHDGKQAIGNFYLSRPGRLRFEYDPPIKDFIVADSFFIYFYDDALGEQSNAPIGQTLADFILRPDVKLSGDIKVTNMVRSGGLLQVTMVQSKDPTAGSITMGFEEKPLRLKKWRVVDAAGSIVEIELFQMEENIAVDRNLFIYRAPIKSRNFN
jgi:outer membrane lipoprotein-sorting protein